MTPNKPRTILISGASSGIGAALATLRCAQGDRLVLLSRRPPISLSDPKSFTHYPVDLSDPQAVETTFKTILKHHPKLDAVISNAGDGRAITHIEQLSPAQIEASIRTNLLSHMWVTRWVWPSLRAQDRADLIFTGSEAALAGAPRGSVYCAAKFGLRGFAQSLRAEAVGTGLRIGIVHPGPVSSPFFDDLDFAPTDAPGASISSKSVAAQISWLLDAPNDCVVDEVIISPKKRQFRKKKKL